MSGLLIETRCVLGNENGWVNLFFPLNDAACELSCGDTRFLEGMDCDRRAASGVAVEDQLLIGG